jgi:hypothetical protein
MASDAASSAACSPKPTPITWSSRLGEQQQQRDDADDVAERAVGRRGVLELVRHEPGADGYQRGEGDRAEDRRGSARAGLSP